MPFFTQFPKKQVKVESTSVDAQGSNILTIQDKTITDIFRHVDVTTLNSENYTSYTFYDIQDGDRPDIISQKLYNTPDFYWTFFIVNDFLQAGFNSFFKSAIDLDRGVSQEYGKFGALLFLPEVVQENIPEEITGTLPRLVTKCINQPGGLQLEKDFVRIVNVQNNATARVYSWTPERLLLTTFDHKDASGAASSNFFVDDQSIQIEAKYVTDTGDRLRKAQDYVIDITSVHAAELATLNAQLVELQTARDNAPAGALRTDAQALVTAKETEIINTRGNQETARLNWLDNFNKQVNSFIAAGTLGVNERTYTEENLNLYKLRAYNVYKDLEAAPYTFKRSLTADGEGEIGEPIAAFDALGRNQGFITNFTSWRDYENANNEARRQIVVVKPEYIERFAEEYRDLITS